MSNNIIQLQNSKKLVTAAVKDGESYLTSCKLRGYPRAFDCAQDKELATQQKQNIIQVREFYLSLLQPSEPTYILGKIEILESRYFEKETDQTVQTQLDREWIEDLSEYPPDLIELACNNWRRSSKNYAPRSAGVLMESVKQEYVRRVVTYRKAVSVLEIIDAD